MKPHVTAITVMTHIAPMTSSQPFVSVFFGRAEQSNSTHFDPTPSSMLRVMRYQAAVVVAKRKAEAKQ